MSRLDERVYYAFARYAFEEPVCWPSQALVARKIGLARETVNRSVRRLRRAGWMRVVERRWSPRNGWQYNVYELLADYAGKVAKRHIKRITQRAHNRLRDRARRLAQRRARRDVRPDHMNTYGLAQVGFGWCGCRGCQHGEPPGTVGAALARGRVSDSWRT